ncbi:MAG TPA: methylmalonyl-CoA epimerase [Candidatus Brocadiia bacterium]|nr:methylmalonyl-CoA epimerase [Planctomycetota bacterium]MDO8092757.1 methylmalonyl-CoA epimerase [Candidatus Brocadiales bacterium]
MFKKIDHIAIATDDIEGALSVYRDIFGIAVTYREVFRELGVEVAALRIGESCIEFVKPLDKDSKVAKFLQERGEGIHHIAFQVEDIEKSIEELKAKGIRVIPDGIKRGIEGKKIAFLHPKDCHNVLIELTQKAEG